LAGEYTLGHVAELMSLFNANTIRFYWLLKSWEFRSPITVTVEKLRTVTTGQGTYAQYATYRNKVLKPSVAELNTKNFEVAYPKNKKGRAVDSIVYD
jgi:plasmid replication initiation protein